MNKVFTEKDLKNADRVGKMRMAVLQSNLEAALSDRDYQYLQILKEARKILLSGKPPFECITLIRTLDEGMWRPKAAQIYKDVQDVYATIDGTHPKVMRGILRDLATENLYFLTQLRDSAAELSDKLKCAEAVAKQLKQLNDMLPEIVETQEVEPFADFEQPELIETTELNEIKALLT